MGPTCAALARLPSLTSLKLAMSSTIQGYELQHLSVVSSLQAVHVVTSNGGIGNVLFGTPASSVLDCVPLVTLETSNEWLTVAALAALGSSTRLTRLQLESSFLSGASVQQLAECIAQLSALQCLVLGSRAGRWFDMYAGPGMNGGDVGVRRAGWAAFSQAACDMDATIVAGLCGTLRLRELDLGLVGCFPGLLQTVAATQLQLTPLVLLAAWTHYNAVGVQQLKAALPGLHVECAQSW